MWTRRLTHCKSLFGRQKLYLLFVVEAKHEAVEPSVQKSDSELVEESQQVLEVVSTPPSELHVAAAAESTIIEQLAETVFAAAPESRELGLPASVEHCELLVKRPSPDQLLAADITQQASAIDVLESEMLGLQTASAADAGSGGDGASVDHREWTTTVSARRCAIVNNVHY